jgi:hypothetical protein
MQYTLFGGRKIMTANGFRWLAVGWLVVAAFGAMPAAAQPVVLAQPGQPAQAGRMQRPYVSPWSGSIQWLAMPAVQKDLELIDDQVEKVNKIRQEMQQEMQDSYKTLSSVPAEERQQKYYDLSVELSERTEKKLMDVLLPEQQDRLRQISLQMRLRNYYALGQQLTSEDLAKKLGISEEQKDRLLALQRELQEEMQQKMREFYTKMNEEAEKRMFEGLTSAQRRELQTMMGERFEWSPWSPPAQGVRKQ